MRNPKRIKIILEKFREFWEKNPDLRFGQIVEIIYSQNETDKFYVEDDYVYEKLSKLIENSPKSP